VSELEQEFRKKCITISLELQDVSCRFDSMRMGQVLQNILLNALDFVPDKTGKIHISLKSDGGNAVITITDNGIGIPKDKIDGLFAKFYQVSADKNRRYGGSGLGLSVCKGIVEGHGGRIWAESDGEGKGTTMHIVIPLADKSA
jgi:signal transduction histidine kinase